jgi:transposase
MDIAAITNAVTSPLSNGFVEGHNNRLKAIKRVMYGRAGTELLEAKVVTCRPHSVYKAYG